MLSRFNLEDKIMKAIPIIIPVILLAAACQRMENATPDRRENAETAGAVYNLTIQAAKGDAQAKALDLVNDGATLNAYWKDSEKVRIYKDNTLLGTLDVIPAAGEKPAKATLSGPITTTGLAANDELILLFPRESWDYTGQAGTLAGIEASCDYAVATVAVATVDDVNHTITATGPANFRNQQSIYRFGFKTGGNYFNPKSFTVSAAGGKLVRRMSWNGSAWAPDYDGITVTPASAPADNFYYVSLRNDQTTDDTYGFIITGSDDVLYMASQAIPGARLAAPGQFISARNVSATKSDFSPAGGGVNDPLEVL